MNKDTNKVTFYIVMFFIGVVVLLGLFFSYKIFFETSTPVNTVDFYDQDFNDVMEKKEAEVKKRKEEKDVEYAQYDAPPCLIGDVVYEHGTVKDFFSRAGVGVYESCADFSEPKKCDNGIWLGDTKFEYSSCLRSVDCKLAEDILIADGETIELYSLESVPYGKSCEPYKGIRGCKETILTGDKAYKYETCRVSREGICTVPDGNGGENVVADERSHTFYSQEQVEYNQSCADFAQNRLCSKGILYGNPSYFSWACSRLAAKNCYIDGVEILHGSSRILYSKEVATSGKTCKFFAEIRSCTDGQLTGQEEYLHASCVD